MFSYRFRLINIACAPNYNFTIAGHSMTIIEADGQNSEPLVVDELQIFVAQRYSFVVRLILRPSCCPCGLVLTPFTAGGEPAGRQLLDSCSPRHYGAQQEFGTRPRDQLRHPPVRRRAGGRAL